MQYKLSWTLTPNATTIIDGLLVAPPRSLEQLAAIANAAFPQFVQSLSPPPALRSSAHLRAAALLIPPILLFDDFLNSPVMPIVMQLNLQRAAVIGSELEQEHSPRLPSIVLEQP